MPNIKNDDLSGDYVRLSVIDTGTAGGRGQGAVFEPCYTAKDVERIGGTVSISHTGLSRGSVGIDTRPECYTKLKLTVASEFFWTASSPPLCRKA
jgi:hypothetical protein